MVIPPDDSAQAPDNEDPIGDNGDAKEASTRDEDALKYHLLGPSLTKAGQDSVDQQKVSEIIYEASKGSKYFKNEEVKNRNLTEKIDRILAKKAELEKTDLTHELRRADEYIAELEASRDLSQVVVHIDCDAFYAAVEELDRPELKEVPMAVGVGVLTTCNYTARKFGCRSGMAGFVARKLCPQLVCLPLNFAKYSAKAEEVRAVLAIYDPRFESAGSDEAYLNITDYCAEHQMDPVDVVSQLRREVLEQAKITVSAGIAANAKLAKIASNKNKPNGQFRLPSDRASILAFMRDLPTRKVNGIGRVFERELDAIGIKRCGDIYAQRALLSKLFGEKAFQFLMQCYLGLGRTSVQPAEDYERKSVGTESTFGALCGKDALRRKLRHIAEELEKDLERTQFKGRTLVLKIKLHTFEVYTRQTVPPKAVHRADDLYRFALPMLSKLENEFPGLTLRLMGLRVTNIVSMKQSPVDFFGTGRAVAPQGAGVNKNPEKLGRADDEEWEVWPEEEFERAAQQEKEAEMKEMEVLSQEHEQAEQELVHKDPPNKSAADVPQAASMPSEEQSWNCPICQRPQRADEKTFNDHIDFCLSKETIKETVQKVSLDTPGASGPTPLISQPTVIVKKRGRPKNETHHNQRLAKRANFFP